MCFNYLGPFLEEHMHSFPQQLAGWRALEQYSRLGSLWFIRLRGRLPEPELVLPMRKDKQDNDLFIIGPET